MLLPQQQGTINTIERLTAEISKITAKFDSHIKGLATVSSEVDEMKANVDLKMQAIVHAVHDLVTAVAANKPEEFYFPPIVWEAMFQGYEGPVQVVTRGVEPGLYKHCHEAFDQIYRIKNNSGAPLYSSPVRALQAYTRAYEGKTLQRIPRPSDQYPERTPATEAKIPSTAKLVEDWADYTPNPGQEFYVITAGPRPGISDDATAANNRQGIAYKVDTLKAAFEAYDHALQNGFVHVL